MGGSTTRACDGCGAVGTTTHFNDNVSDPHRELELCADCITMEKGAVFLAAILHENDQLPPELVDADRATLIELGHALDNSFLDAMDVDALAKSESEDDPEALRSLAEVLQLDAGRLGRGLSPAQQAFVDRYGGRS
jgi:hypothetical protein